MKLPAGTFKVPNESPSIVFTPCQVSLSAEKVFLKEGSGLTGFGFVKFLEGGLTFQPKVILGNYESPLPKSSIPIIEGYYPLENSSKLV